ncbi:MAG TPA: hypothetical protein V6D00_14005 [Pantanalinema sp.]
MTPHAALLSLEWIGFVRDLVGVSALATILVYLYKLLRPSHEIDRIGFLALAVATTGTVAGLVLGLVVLRAVVPWAAFSLSALLVFWVLELEFGTRLLGLCAALVLALGAIFMATCLPLYFGSLPWLFLTASGASASAGLLAFAATTALPSLLHHTGGALTARKTSRFFALGPSTIAETAYRTIAWALPVQLASLASALIGLYERQVAPLPVGLMGLATFLAVLYAVWCRRAGFGFGYRPWLLLLLGGASLAAMRLLAPC